MLMVFSATAKASATTAAPFDIQERGRGRRRIYRMGGGGYIQDGGGKKIYIGWGGGRDGN